MTFITPEETIETKVEQDSSGGWLVFTSNGSSMWGVGVTFKSRRAAEWVADTIKAAAREDV